MATVRRRAIRLRWAGGWKPGFGGIEAGDAARSGSCGAVVRAVGGPPLGFETEGRFQGHRWELEQCRQGRSPSFLPWIVCCSKIESRQQKRPLALPRPAEQQVRRCNLEGMDQTSHARAHRRAQAGRPRPAGAGGKVTGWSDQEFLGCRRVVGQPPTVAARNS
jgi:hypothetical protein